MKWTIIFLVVFGVVAAVCVVLLVNAFRADTSIRAGRGEVPVVTAARDLPVWTALTTEDVQVGKVQKSEAPSGYYPNTALVVGKVLSVDVVEGQILTKSQMLTQGGPADIAALLSPGMRAVSVRLSQDQISGGLLYPRCFVDVLASFQLSGSRAGDSRGEALSTTLLERVKVLAVAGQSMLSTPDEEGEEPVRSGRQQLTVTLELDSKQAEALQLAVNNGTISLALRNPTDTEPVPPEATLLDREELGRLGSLLGAKVEPSNPPEVNWGGTEGSSGSSTEPPTPSRHSVRVIRGQKVGIEAVKPKKEAASAE